MEVVVLCVSENHEGSNEMDDRYVLSAELSLTLVMKALENIRIGDGFFPIYLN